MILPVIAYGDPVLRKVGKNISKDYPNFKELLTNMLETMDHASGVGLAAPQIGLDIRLFIIDSTLMMDEGEEHLGIKEVFINAEMIEEVGEEWAFEEGCLSIPHIRDNVYRKDTITIKYLDQNFKEHTKTFDGLTARVIQHEYDHIEGKLFCRLFETFEEENVAEEIAKYK